MNLRRFAAAAVLALMAGIGNFTSPVLAADSGAKKVSTEERLRRLEDIESIRALIVAYGRNFDKRDYVAYGNLFAKEGLWIGGAESTSSYKGPEAIRAFVEKTYPASVFPGSYHIMSSIDVTLDGKDSATAWSRWTFVVRGVRQEPVLYAGGWYDDTFVREDGEWKFKSRRVFSDPVPK